MLFRRLCSRALAQSWSRQKSSWYLQCSAAASQFLYRRQGDEETAVFVFVNLAVAWYAIGRQAAPLGKIKPIFQIQLFSQVCYVPLLDYEEFLCFLVMHSLACISGKLESCLVALVVRSLLIVNWHAESRTAPHST